MNKTLSVLKNEIIVTVARRSFLLIALGVPLVSILGFVLLSALNRRAPNSVAEFFSSVSAPGQKAEGFVDQSGLIKTIPDSIPEAAFKAFPSRAAALQALRVGEITGYYLIPDNYLETGDILNVRPDFNPLSAFDQSSRIQWILKVNLLGGDVHLASLVNRPLVVNKISQAPSPQRDQQNPLTFFLPYAVTLAFYIIILMSASYLLNSVTKEKENRVLEILMLSISPRQMLVGKIIALGLVGLLQTVLWIGTGYSLLRLSGRTFSLPQAFQLPLSFLVWGLVFFLLGYAIYASLMASLGALVPDLREASQATFIVILPLIIPLMMIGVMIEAPNGTLALALSLFPLTASVVMMTRLAATSVPLWQLLLSAGLQALTVLLLVRTVAGMFRAQVLLSGQPFNLRRLVNALLGSS
ncbi:MAG TPA: ABC transporter permease [Anaerolineales bacterium]|nr:ABC transporter permease [Anaerolineales bacterium]